MNLATRTAPWVLLSCICCAATAAIFGPDANWDLRNYHLYVAWAWLGDRHALDLAAAQAQTWFSPLLWVPHFFAFERLGATTLAALIGALQGLCAWPLLSIAARLLPDAAPAVRLLAVACGMTAASFIGQLGASYGDSLIALLLLAAVALLLRQVRRANAGYYCAAIAGLLLGAAPALKLAIAPVALGLCLALPLLASNSRQRLVLVAIVGISAVLAFGSLAGPWMYFLWHEWGNPVFPQFASIFGEQWVASGAARDLRFVPGTLWEAAIRPFAPLVDWRATSDYRIRDARILLLCVAVALLAIRWRHIEAERQPMLRWLAGAFVLGYLIWLPLFGYHRYLMGWEMLAPLLLVAASANGTGRQLALTIVVLAMLGTNPPNHERAGRSWPAGAPLGSAPITLAPDTLLVMASVQPISHVLPFLPPFAAAVRIESNLHGGVLPDMALDALASARIADHAGTFSLLLQATDPASADAVLAAVGLQRTSTPCIALDAALVPDAEPPIQLCVLHRLGGAN